MRKYGRPGFQDLRKSNFAFGEGADAKPLVGRYQMSNQSGYFVVQC